MFQEFLGTMGLAEFNLNTDLYKIGLVDSVLTPVTGATDPGWAAGRTTDYSANQVATSANYVDGGKDITNTYAEAAGVGKFDAADQAPYVGVDGSNATDARWGIIYNDTDVDKKAIGFLDLGAVFDMTTGDLNITWNASGIFTFTLS
jgi:hypothetical protein